MNSITIVLTRFKRLRAPQPLPELTGTRAEAVAFFSGWWHGIAVGAVCGAGIAVVLRGVF